MKAITKTSIDIPEEAEAINVCEAIEKMIEERETKGKLDVLGGLVKDGILTVKDAAARLNMTEDEFREAVKNLN